MPSVEQPAQAEVIPLVRSKTNAAEKPQHLEKSKAKGTSADKRKSKLPQQPKQQGQLTKSAIMTALTALTLTSCSTTIAEQYEATALTSYSWQVKYANDLTSQPQPRIET